MIAHPGNYALLYGSSVPGYAAGDSPDAAEVALRTVAAWSAVFGAVSFELFGHLVDRLADDLRLATAQT